MTSLSRLSFGAEKGDEFGLGLLIPAVTSLTKAGWRHDCDSLFESLRLGREEVFINCMCPGVKDSLILMP